MLIIQGNVETITFYNEENGYCILRFSPEELHLGSDGGNITVVGHMPEVQPGEYLRFSGDWRNHPRFGKQFQADTVERILPVSKEGIKRYLSSGLVKGIGATYAERIVDHFGTDTLKILDEAPHRLREVDQIGKMRAESIANAWADQRDVAEIMAYLQQFQIGTATALRIHRFYKEQQLSPVQVIQHDPYQLCRDIQGIGFKTADKIAQRAGIAPDSLSRLQAGIIYVLEQAALDGHVYLPAGKLLDDAAELLNTDNVAALETALTRIYQDGDVRTADVINPYTNELIQAVYTPSLFHSERGVVRAIHDLLNEPESRLDDYDENTDWDGRLGSVGLTDQQAEAVRIALTHKLSILTGGPGTGKTTTLRALITILEADEHQYLLASPTGRAAKRLHQATGRRASTIHRMLGFSFLEGFVFNQENTLEADVVVIDEASMLDLHLFHALMRAIHPKTHLVLVGDVDQLPSVGAGDVLRDLIRSNIAPVTRLNTIFRQAGGSLIIDNAHRINQGELPDVSNKGDDFYFFGAEDPIEAADLLVDVVHQRIPNKFGFDPIDDIQVLAPMYRTPVGVNTLNEKLQAAINPPGRQAEKRFGEHIFRVGDKVLQTRNNYDKDVFNGDIGIIKTFDFSAQTVVVTVDERDVSYDWVDAFQLTLAYACSVHRSQGSEYPVVVMPLLTQHYMMLQRNLFYTAITRAKQMVVLVGTRRAISIAVQNNEVSKRWSALDWLLQR